MSGALPREGTERCRQVWEIQTAAEKLPVCYRRTSVYCAPAEQTNLVSWECRRCDKRASTW